MSHYCDGALAAPALERAADQAGIADINPRGSLLPINVKL